MIGELSEAFKWLASEAAQPILLSMVWCRVADCCSHFVSVLQHSGTASYLTHIMLFCMSMHFRLQGCEGSNPDMQRISLGVWVTQVWVYLDLLINVGIGVGETV